jgi:hypothetical protein
MGIKTARENQEYQNVSRNRDLYSDLNHIFLPHPKTKQIGRKTNVDAVKLAVRNLVLTNKYERLRNPDFGGNIRRYLFEPMVRETEVEIQNDIKYLIEQYEPRARVLEVYAKAAEDENSIYVRITFSVLTNPSEQSVDLTLYRVR